MAAQILIVDDSSTDRMVIGNMLADFEILTACDGIEALRLIEAHPDLDLVILDLHMPNMDGFQLLEKLKAGKNPMKTPVLILTNYDELDKEIRGLKLGAEDYIRKPVNLESLRVRVETHLELNRMQRLVEERLKKSNHPPPDHPRTGSHRHFPLLQQGSLPPRGRPSPYHQPRA